MRFLKIVSILLLVVIFGCKNKEDFSKPKSLQSIIETYQDHEGYDRSKYPLGLYTKDYYESEADFAQNTLDELLKIDKTKSTISDLLTTLGKPNDYKNALSRGMLNKKYDTEFCLFETTSLYGNIKGTSMYDGMRPYLRYKGDTQSKFLLTLGEEIYPELKEWFTEKNGGEELIRKGASSRKLKIQTKMVGIIKSSLKQHDTKSYELFSKEIAKAGEITTQKRFYMSEYGYSNVKNVLLGKENTLTKGENYDSFELENVVKWWKKKATKRYNNVIADGRIRKELEVWNQNTMNKIDIIR